MPQQKKLFVLLIGIVLTAGLLFANQIKQARNIVINPTKEPIINTNLTDIPLGATDQILGNPGSPLTLVLFADLGCAECQTVYYSISKFITSHPQEARLFFKDAPSTGWFSDGNILAHQAAYCAGKQNKFWQFIDLVMKEKTNLKEAGLKKTAEALQLNTGAWWQCASSEEAKNYVADNASLAQALGIKTIPALFINNKKINLTSDIDLAEMLNKFITKE